LPGMPGRDTFDPKSYIMIDITHISRKTDKVHFFEVDLNWLSHKEGILSAHDVGGTLHVATPPSFGGEGREWSPEHLFLSAISSCYMTTFLHFLNKVGVNITKFSCNSIGQIHLVEGKYKFTQVDVYPKIMVSDESAIEKVSGAVQKTHQYCLISNSVDARIIYHPQILVDEPKNV
jgi:peroxiredoxin-like protein